MYDCLYFLSFFSKHFGQKQQKEKEGRKRKLYELYRESAYQKCECERVKEAVAMTKRYQQRENGEDIRQYFRSEVARLDEAFEKKAENERLRDTPEDAPLQDFASLLGFGDIQIERLAVDLRCPISRTTMVNPMKNSECGHTYDERNIKELLGRRATIRCPVAGCAAVVRANTLVLDKDLLKEIAKPKRMRTQRREENEDEYAVV